MSGLLFQTAPSPTTSAPNRADLVCFIGFVARRPTPLGSELKTWLREHGWRPSGAPIDDADELANVPVPLDSFEAFDRLYAWETRPPVPHAFPFSTWLGAAVRAFFRQGGARCFVVRIADPAAYATGQSAVDESPSDPLTPAQRNALARLLPGFGGGAIPSPDDRASWKGLGVLHGLEEAAFVCLPDLPELVADAALEPAGLAPVEPGPEVFVECTPQLTLPKDETRQISTAPACTEAGFSEWRAAARYAASFIRTHRRDVQLVLSLPLPSPDIGTNHTRNLDEPTHTLGLGQSLDMPRGIASAFLQLCYPWLQTVGSETLPGGLEPPDGTFAGVLARAIPRLGAAHSVGHQPLRGVHGFEPPLAVPDLELDTPQGGSPALIHRVSLLGRTPDGPRVLSDVTTTTAAIHRPAAVGRLTAAILRTARQLGDRLTFEPSGEELWARVRTQLDQLLSDFYAAGALRGDRAEDAYSIRCDRTTTSQNDLDNGRVIAEVRFAPSHPVGLIVVTLALRDGGVSVVESSG